MARSRGYNNYRGRRSKGKAALAVLLILVILAAVVVILLQRNIIYDETGTPRMEVPWQGETTEQETPFAGLDLVIQTPEKTVGEICGFRLPAGQLTRERYESYLASVNSAYDAVAVVLKDETGTVYFDAAAAVSESVEIAEDTPEVLTELTDSETLHTIAQINCFHDPKAAKADLEGMGLKNTGGYLFYDGNNSQWLDPAKSAARQYVRDLAVEAAELGFDEILLTGLSYPTVGELDKIAYGDAAKNVNLLTFLKELQTALEPYDTVISVELSADLITNGQDEAAGLVLAEILPEVDRVCAAVLPEEAETVAETLKNVREDIVFVPILEESDPSVTGSWLLT